MEGSNEKVFDLSLILPINSDKIRLHEGDGNGTGILYCGKQYTGSGQCQCHSCDGVCGPNNGCACPECECILSFYLYSSGKMKCNYCNNTLIRLSLKNLQALTGGYNSFGCDVCKKCYSSIFIPVLHCFSCEYDVCPPCAIKRIDNSNIINIPNANQLIYGEGLLYCGKKFTNKCICGGCDGSKYNNLLYYIKNLKLIL